MKFLLEHWPKFSLLLNAALLIAILRITKTNDQQLEIVRAENQVRLELKDKQLKESLEKIQDQDIVIDSLSRQAAHIDTILIPTNEHFDQELARVDSVDNVDTLLLEITNSLHH